MPFIPALLAGLGTFAKIAMASMVLKLFLILGVALASGLVVMPLLNDLLSQAESAWSAIPQPYASYMGIAQLDVGITILISASMARATLAGFHFVARSAS